VNEQGRDFEVAIVGAGFSGIAMAAKLRRAGREDFVVFERGSDVGGTWRDNHYPGCACDVPSHVYSFSFAPNPDWTTTYAEQGEILAYLRRVAASEGVLAHVRFGCDVEEARWDEAAARWRIRTAEGEFAARALVNAAGPFSDPKLPEVPGLGGFEGEVFHSAEWDHDYDLSGKRVAVIGTGASSIQFVPRIQPQVASLRLFQRTPPWIVPRTSRPLSELEHRLYRRFPGAQQAMRGAVSLAREAIAIPMVQARLSAIIRAVAASHLRRQVPDRALRAKLTPDYAPGCKRILISNDYLPALAEPNVEVIASGLGEVRPRSVLALDGSEREVDAVIFGTGFNVTEPPIATRIHGADGRTLSGAWADTGMQAHRGTTVAGFPNFFFLLGPNTGLGHNSVMLMAEAQADYTVQALGFLDRGALAAIEPLPAAQARWNDEVHERGRGTVWVDGGCASWYLDRHGRNTTVWPGFSTSFRRELSRFDASEYATAVGGRAGRASSLA
jgi:cation diffusion facilitator CzcD-associated flavoprotein CzcO